METKNKIRLYSLDEVKDELIGKSGTPRRTLYEQELQLEILGEMIKKARLDRHLTQEELGRLVGIQKSQISKLENNANNVTIETLLKVFGAMKAKISFSVKMQNQKLTIA